VANNFGLSAPLYYPALKAISSSAPQLLLRKEGNEMALCEKRMGKSLSRKSGAPSEPAPVFLYAMNLIQKDKIAQLHLIRAIAAIGVVLTHAKFVLWSGGEAYMARFPIQKWTLIEYPLFFSDLVNSLGTPRVYLFFILSGFFLQYSIRSGFLLLPYLRRRFLRLYPAFIATTLLAGIVLYVSVTYLNSAISTESIREYNSRLAGAYHDLTFTSLLHSLSFTNAGEYYGMNSQYWSLKHEVIFCLLFPIYNFFSIRSQFGLLGLCLAFAITTGSYIAYCQLFFLVGILFYKGFDRGLRVPVVLPTWLYGAAFIGLYLGVYLLGKLSHVYFRDILTVVLAFLALEFLLTRTIRVPRVVVWFSKVSYSVYLNHMWVLLLYYAVLSRLSGDLVFYSRWQYYTGALLSIIFSLPVYYIIEKPVLAYMHRLGTNGRYRAPAVQPIAVRTSAKPQAPQAMVSTQKGPVELSPC
jgi:peptidoglycan/LPS O-acetylase OafA/YrhL